MKSFEEKRRKEGKLLATISGVLLGLFLLPELVTRLYPDKDVLQGIVFLLGLLFISGVAVYIFNTEED